MVLSDEITRSAFGYCTGKKDSQGKDIFEYPEVQEHPRNGISCHQWVQQMVKEVLGKDKPESWLDWREYEPEWIQFKFQGSEFDLERLDKLATENSNILTKEILTECKI